MDNKKKILFLHPNFPGQFKHLAIFLGKQSNCDVKFLCMTNFGNHIKGVLPLIIKGDRSQETMDGKIIGEFNKMLFRAESYRRAFLSLARNSWDPDIVIGHTGWGCGIHVKEIWPKARFCAYAEWWFEAFTQLKPEMKSNQFLGVNQKSQSKLWHRNRIISFELCTADAIVAPSNWQKDQLPVGLQKNCRVIPDGIDINYFSEKTTAINPKPLLTYGTRGMEPMRCFEEFIKSLPYLLEKYKNLEIEIAGEDKICYGGLKPTKNSTWGQWAKNYLSSGNFDKRVTWHGRLSTEKYRDWLQRSWCHVYLSRPFVCSWSLLEALACGNLVIASNTSPVKEYCNYLNGVRLVNHENPKLLAKNIAIALKDTQKLSKKDLRVSRQDLLSKVSVHTSLQGWLGVTGLDPNTCC